MGYRLHALKGVGWFAFVKLYAKSLTVLKMVILARVLSPADLGAFGLAAILILLTEIFTETGINTFLIQSKEHISKYVDTAWVTSILRGVLIGGLLSIAAWPLSIFYGNSSLLPLVLIAAAVALVRGFINPSIILWQKELSFRHEAVFRAFLFTLELGVGISLAFVWQNSLGLMFGILASAVMEVVLSHLLLAPKPKLRWNKQIFLEVFGFGRWHNLNAVIFFLGQTSDDLIVGRILGSGNLGYYQTAFNIAQSATTDLGDSVSQSMYPIYAKLHDDMPRLRRAMVYSLLPLAALVAGGCIILILFAEPIVRLVLGAKWLPVLPVLPWMLASGWLQSLNNLIYPIYLVKGEPKQQLAIHFWYWLILIVLMVPMSAWKGLTGAGMTLLIARLAVQPLMLARLRGFWKRWGGQHLETQPA